MFFQFANIVGRPTVLRLLIDFMMTSANILATLNDFSWFTCGACYRDKWLRDKRSMKLCDLGIWGMILVIWVHLELILVILVAWADDFGGFVRVSLAILVDSGVCFWR